jgi:hypothetical protein
LAVLLLVALAADSAPARAGERGADGHFDQRRSSHFVLYQDVAIDRRSGWRGSIRFEREVLAALEDSYERLDALLGLRPRRSVTVVIYDPAAFEHRFAGLFRFEAAGFYHGTIRIRGDTRVTLTLLHVLQHELVHAAFDQAARSLPVPAWLNEGLAEWFAYRTAGRRHLAPGEATALRAAAHSGALPPLSELGRTSFAHLHPEAVSLAYLESYALIEHLARRHGEESLRRLCQQLLRSRSLERTLHRVYGAGLDELEAGFRREALGSFP